MFVSKKPPLWLIGLIACGLWCGLKPISHARPPDPPREVLLSIKRVTVEQAHEMVGGPTLITLNFDNQTPQAVYEELFRQAGITPRLPHPDFWTQHETPLTIHFERKPFWDAVRELESRTELTIYFMHGPSEYSLGTMADAARIAPFLQGPRIMRDSFQIVAGAISWKQYRTLYLPNRPAGENPEEGAMNNDGALRTLSLYVLPDPKFDTLRGVSVHVETAVDEKGNSLLTSTPVSGADHLGSFPPRVSLNLSRPGGRSRAFVGADASRKIALLKGKIRLVFVSANETWVESVSLRQ